MKLTPSVLLLACSVYFMSCATQQKIPGYLQNLTDTTGRGKLQVPELRIQKNDLLSIQVYSASTRPEVDALYNMPAVAAAGAGQTGATAPATSGYLVNSKGDIEYPRLGTFHAEGLTKEELAAQISKRLTEPVQLLINPTVIVRFINLKITVLGEVNTQGVISIPGERVTILEAVGLAGGINDFGMKNAVKISRETDGQRQVGLVDLSSKDLFSSPYYYLRQNDVVFVDPTPGKAKAAQQDRTVQQVTLGVSLITAVALIINIFR
ncbi:MAG: polysaccharide biosynthesis/export family protein [Chitinophagaceae bacterium]